jgi:hypothetical protein
MAQRDFDAWFRPTGEILALFLKAYKGIVGRAGAVPYPACHRKPPVDSPRGGEQHHCRAGAAFDGACLAERQHFPTLAEPAQHEFLQHRFAPR